MSIVTVIAPVNIAVIKYWGKRDEELILPVNDSISCTLDMEHMCAKTSVMASPSFTENKFWLNGKEEDFNSKRLQNCLREVRHRAKNTDILKYNLHIASENNFPTAAGLASSAAGYACLVSSLGALYKVDGDLSSIARQGSGSACRSVYGGFVHWIKGERADGTDSIAVQLAPASHWDDLHVLILVVSQEKKTYSSTIGMKATLDTSKLLKHRVEALVPPKISAMIEAIASKDFAKFGRLTMEDSNQFHAVCLDTYPPCFYMNDISKLIIELVHAYNDQKGDIRVAYTFDAGANACLYLLKQDVPEFVSLINKILPGGSSTEYFKGLPVSFRAGLDLDRFAKYQQEPGKLQYVIHTKVGDGPKVLSDKSQHLFNHEGELKVNI